MPYILNKTNGAKLVTLQDATLDKTTDLTFVGRNYSGYGEVFNENFIKLLENFSNNTAPSKPIQGQLYFDNTSGVRQLKLCYDGKNFKPVANMHVTSSKPSPAASTVGDLFWDTSKDQLYVYNGSDFKLLGPTSAGSTRASWEVAEEKDNVTSISSPIIKGKFGSDISLIVTGLRSDITSLEPTSSDLTNTADFGNGIKRGITLKGTDANGSSRANGHFFWGTAGEALSAVTATNITSVSTSQNATHYVSFVKGNSDKGLYTATNFTYNPSTSVLNAVATSARFADLAEMYLPDKNYPAGTAVTIGGTAEVTACKDGDRAIGVVSANPAYLMNSGLAGGIPIALKGRVQVFCSHPIAKGDRLIAGYNGRVKRTFAGNAEVFAIALNDSIPGAMTVEALIL